MLIPAAAAAGICFCIANPQSQAKDGTDYKVIHAAATTVNTAALTTTAEG